MTTDCLNPRCDSAAPTRLHDAILGLAVTVIFIVPATLALFAVL
ncbi:hypothetical protein [Phenylobacterium sp.]